MHIKNIIINGFRSYRDQSFPEELSPKHNVIIGKNGSGKSNFFSAVQFVLSEKYTNLRTSERRELFHTGTSNALFVSVEIVFDNSDGRIVVPTDGATPTVSIRRTLGLKQDEYRVNNRKYSASEVRQLLESAGFSAANPYYIVEQGKIISLTQMQDDERYELLKEVAGTGVYEARRAESREILDETAGRAEKIDEAVGQLDAQLDTLKAESAELKNYQDADQKRKALEYAIFTTELQHAKDDLERLEAQWGSKTSATEAELNQIAQLDRERADLESKAAEAARRVTDLEQQRGQVDRERNAIAHRKNELELRDGDSKAENDRVQGEKRALEVEQTELGKATEKHRKDLEGKKGKADGKQAEVLKAQSEYQEAAARLDSLQARRGRKNKFSTAAQRDKWLRDEIAENEKQVKNNSGEIKRLEDESKNHTAQLAALKNSISSKKNEGSAQEKQTNDMAKKREDILAQRNKLGEERRQYWARVNEQEKIVKRKKEELERLKERYNKVVRFDIRQGLQSLDETLTEINDPNLSGKVYGQIVNLFNCDRANETAVEVTIGNAMFNVVVDSFDISQRILNHMNHKKKPGRVTFFPLDTCRPRDPISAQDVPDVLPLIEKVRYDSNRFGRVFHEVFGRTLLAGSLESGANASKNLDADVVTVDGDQFSRRGAVTGGFIDPRNMKLPIIRDLAKIQDDLVQESRKLHELCERVGMLELEITQVVQSLDASYSQETEARRGADDVRSDLRQTEENITRLTTQIEQGQKSIQTLQRSNNNIGSVIATLKTELASPFGSSLTEAEGKELDRLQSSIGALRNASDSGSAQLVQLQTEVQLLDDTLHHLEGRLHAVSDRIALISRPTNANRLVSTEMKAVEADFNQINQQLAAVEKSIEETVLSRRKFLDDAQTVAKNVIDAQRAAQEGKDSVDRFHNKRSLLVQKRDEAQSKIRKLGIIPSNADQFLTHGLGKLMQLLKGANEELQKFSHVNKKALDQFQQLTETRDGLDKQRESLKEELEQIHSMISTLDKEKQAAIERTYKQIQYEFESVFKGLVRTDGASAELQLVANPDYEAPEESTNNIKTNSKKSSRNNAKNTKKKSAAPAAKKSGKKNKNQQNDDDDDESEDEDDVVREDKEENDQDENDEENKNTSDPFSAIRIKVCFGLGEPTADLSQLSGGQKSLVALALIFAIQRSDPAPFYLFDEIDAALDAEYRTNVARMLQKQSEKCQFITVSFKTEMLDVADQVYRIEFFNKVSKILRISGEEGAMVLKMAQSGANKAGNNSSNNNNVVGNDLLEGGASVGGAGNRRVRDGEGKKEDEQQDEETTGGAVSTAAKKGNKKK